MQAGAQRAQRLELLVGASMSFTSGIGRPRRGRRLAAPFTRDSTP